jgi:hypothetical protein
MPIVLEVVAQVDENALSKAAIVDQHHHPRLWYWQRLRYETVGWWSQNSTSTIGRWSSPDDRGYHRYTIVVEHRIFNATDVVITAPGLDLIVGSVTSTRGINTGNTPGSPCALSRHAQSTRPSPSRTG